MTTFNPEELKLFEFILKKILSNKKGSNKDDCEEKVQNPTAQVDYVGETFYQSITYGGDPFLLIFKKHFIDSNPQEKYDKSFMVRVNNFFDKDVFQTSFETHPRNWRLNFQEQVDRITGNQTYKNLKKYDKESFVKGISLQVWYGQNPLNILNPGKDIIYEDEENSIYIQTNNIKKAKENTIKYFLKIILKVLDTQLKANDRKIKKILKRKRKKR
ncbi:MAG: hypothetical protein ACJZ8J_02510 [Candidatus Pelagibacter sp.]